MKVVRRFYRLGAALLLTSGSAVAGSDPGAPPLDPPAPTSPAASPTAPSGSSPKPSPPAQQPATDGDVPSAARAEAARAFDRGKALLDRGAHAEALAEFERAYALSPAYQVLYNIGGLNLQLERWAAARRAYDLYLKLGGPDLSPERITEVQQHLEVLSQKTATLTLTLNVPGADVHVDGAPVATTAISGLVLEPGQHVVRVSKPGFKPLEQVLHASEGENFHLVLPLARTSAAEPPLPAQSPFAIAPTPRVEPVRNGAAIERSSVWLPWTITGVFAAGWITTAGLAIKARSDRNTIERPETSAERIDSARRLHQTLAVVSDVLLVSTLASAGVSAYLTWWPQADPTSSPSSTRSPAVVDGVGLFAYGRF